MSDEFGEFERCPRCREWHWTTKECAPFFYAWLVEDWGDDITTLDDIHEHARKMHTHGDHEAAAEKAAELDDSYSCEYRIVGGSEVEIRVLKSDDVDLDKVQSFIVSGESVPSYSARKKE